MGSLSIWHWLLVIGVGVLLFGGKGKISSVMGDFAKGIKAFKSGMKEPEEETAGSPPPQVTPPPATPTASPPSANPPAAQVIPPETSTAGTASVGATDRTRERV